MITNKSLPSSGEGCKSEIDPALKELSGVSAFATAFLSRRRAGQISRAKTAVAASERFIKYSLQSKGEKQDSRR